MSQSRFVPILVSLCALVACARPMQAPIADVIYAGGPILTMEAATPVAEALAVANGRILAVGAEQDVARHRGDATRTIDLDGRTLMPGFVDAHSHLTLTTAKLAVANLDPPPAGPAASIAAIQDVLRARLESEGVADLGWLVGWGYDHAMLEEKRHPTRFDLDAVSPDVPIVLIHFSGHQVVVNSLGLERAGISASTADPTGGRIERLPGSRVPNGILQENAMYGVAFPVLDGLQGGGPAVDMAAPPDAATLERLERAVRHYVAQGHTTIGEMAATPLGLRLLRAGAADGRFPVDVFAAALTKAYSPEQVASIYSPDYQDRFRVGGAKIVLDGGSPGRTAHLRAPYHRQLPGERDYRGFSHFGAQEDVDVLVTAHMKAGNPLFIHALGDAAVDEAIHALRAARSAVPDGDRSVQLIHVQQIGEDQLDALPALDARITLQVAHNFYFGDFHTTEIYGPERTARLNPARSALDRGLSVSLHHDSPVHPVDPWMLVWNAVTRTTRSGAVIGPEQRLTVAEALRASTLEAARQLHEADDKGSLAPGKRADLIVLDRNPLEIEPATLRDVRVLQTIKDGEVVYAAE